MNTVSRTITSRIPGLRYLVARSIFLGPKHNSHRFLGVFPTYAAAKAQVPIALNREFDAVHENEIEKHVHVRDARVIEIMESILPNAKSLFDLGGNVGSSFYQYRRELNYPDDFLWTVCDTPAVNEAGERLAAEHGETQLAFTQDRMDANGSDIYLTNGALQYFEKSFAKLLQELSDLPTHLLANRIPLTEGRDFYTLQHTGYSVVPYFIASLDGFVASIVALGYELSDQWENDRICDIILRPERKLPRYYGFHFVRRAR